MKTALIIIDMMNTFQFADGDKLLKFARPAARNIARLRERFHRAGLPVVYVNDNFGRWRETWKEIISFCEDSEGSGIIDLLRPTERDYFVIKPAHSGFHSTPLDTLLRHLRVNRVVVTGIAGNICVLLTALEAHMRKLAVVVPRDTLASNTRRDNEIALSQLKHGMKIATPESRNLTGLTLKSRRS